MTNLPNPIDYDGVPYCRSQCDLFCGTETTAKCRLGFAGEDGTCSAAEMIADLVDNSRQTCNACAHGCNRGVVQWVEVAAGGELSGEGVDSVLCANPAGNGRGIWHPVEWYCADFARKEPR